MWNMFVPGDVMLAVSMLLNAKDVREAHLEARMLEKAQTVKQYLHHQEAA